MSSRPSLLHVSVDRTSGAHPTNQLETIYWWTPFLGPTASVAAAHLAHHAATKPHTPVVVDELRTMLGLGQLPGRVWRTLDRLESFGALQFHSTDTITVRSHLRALNDKQIEKLPPHLAVVYRRVVLASVSMH